MRILDLLFPKRCVNCGRLGAYFCESCRLLIRPIGKSEQVCPMCGLYSRDGSTHSACKKRYSIDGLTSLFHYAGPVRKGIKAIKYRLATDIAEEFVSIVSVPLFTRYTLIPVPLYKRRLRERGFNQAEVFGNVLGARLHIPMRIAILRRVRETRPQAETKSRLERVKNMDHVFESSPVSGNILLVDDVFTTGATMKSAAEALKRAGARRVWALTIAR